MEFKLNDDYIELYKLIKVLGLVDSGADAKQLVSEGHVRRNGEVELRKRAKILQGEIIEIAEVTIKVI
jgi:ribosome-associated protein